MSRQHFEGAAAPIAVIVLAWFAARLPGCSQVEDGPDGKQPDWPFEVREESPLPVGGHWSRGGDGRPVWNATPSAGRTGVR